jgi:archaellum component FlaC
MFEAKLDQILTSVTKLEQDVGALKQDVGGLKQDVGGLKQDVGGLKQDVGGLKQDVGGLKQDVGGLKQDVGGLKEKQDEMLIAFRAHWADMSSLHRAVREDLRRFEDRVENKLTQVNQSIQALKDSIERQDFRSDELGRRIERLELKPPL